MRFHAEKRVLAVALPHDLYALDRIAPDGREIDVIEQAVIVLVPRCLVQKRAHHGLAMADGGVERRCKLFCFRAHELRQGNCGQALQGRFHRAADRAGIEHVFRRVIAAVHARQHQIGARALQHVIKPGQHTIGRAAFGGIAAIIQFAQQHRVGVANAMTHARLLECRRDNPDLACRSGNAGRDLFQNFQTGRVDSIVIRYQNSHDRPMVALSLA